MAEIADFKAAANKPGYAKLSQTEVVLTTPQAEGNLVQIFNFAKAEPFVLGYVVKGETLDAVSSKQMSQLTGSNEITGLSDAYVALKQLGGDPFKLQQQLAPKPKQGWFS